MCWVDSKEFATTFSINYESLRKACLRASKVDKNFCKLKCQNIHFKYTKGIGGCSGKVLQIWSEPFESELDAMKFIANSTLKVENDNTISSSKDSVIVCDDSKRDSVGGKGKGDLESNTQTQYFELSQEQKDKATSRLKLIKEYESAKKRGVCVADFIKSHPLDFNEPLNESKLFRWVREYKKRGLSALADKRGVGRTGITKLEEWMREHLLEAFRSHGAGGINMLELWNSLHKEAHRRMGYDYYGFLQSKVKPLCDYGTVKRFIDNYYSKNILEHVMVTKGEDKAKSYLQPAFGKQGARITSRNQLWQIDSSPFDAIVLDDDGRQIRPNILSIIDVYSGRCVVSLEKTSNSLALVRLMWKALERFGKPKSIKGDNGKDYLSKQFQELLNGLGIDYDRSIAYAGDEKGFVERHFKTIQHSSISFLSGYIGNSLAKREAIEQRTPKRERGAKDENGNAIKTNQKNLITFKDAVEVLEESVLMWDIAKVRRKSKTSPIERWNACENELVGVAYSTFLLYASDGVKRKVTKKGVVMDSLTYVSAELPVVGTEIITRANIDNLQELYVFDTNGKFLCVAMDTSVGAVNIELYKAAKRAYAQQTKEVRKFIKNAEISTFTKQNISYDLQMMKEAHAKQIKDESKRFEDENISKIIDEQKEIEQIKTRRFEAPDVKVMERKRVVSWDELAQSTQQGA